MPRPTQGYTPDGYPLPAEPGSVPVGAEEWAGVGAESWSDSALSWRVHRAHPLFIPALLRSSTVPSRGITGLRGGSSPCLSARRGSSCPGLARSPLQGHELGMASPVLRGRLGGGRRTGEAWGQLKSSHLLKEPFKGRLMGPSEGTRGPSPCFCRDPGAPCLGRQPGTAG